jgi:hypothetical protein
MVPVCAPVSVGAKVALIVQLAPPAKLPPHALLCTNGKDVLIVKGIVVPVALLLVTVKVFAALVEPRVTEPKARDVGEIVIGFTPVPVTVSVCGLPAPV